MGNRECIKFKGKVWLTVSAHAISIDLFAFFQWLVKADKKMRSLKGSDYKALEIALSVNYWDCKFSLGRWADLQYIIIVAFGNNSNPFSPFLLSKNVNHNFTIILCPSEILSSRK